MENAHSNLSVQPVSADYSTKEGKLYVAERARDYLIGLAEGHISGLHTPAWEQHAVKQDQIAAKYGGERIIFAVDEKPTA